MTWLARLAEILVSCAARIMPDERGEWGRAMSAEVPHIKVSRSALAFATGCLWSAVSERATTLTRTPELAAGLAAGAFYAVHAAIPNSERWPWMWPIAAGVLIAVGPKAFHSPGGLLSALKAGAKAGAACGIVFFSMAVAFVALRSWLMEPAPSLESRLGLLLYGAVGAVFVAAACATTARFADILRRRL
jgi:hypothetical protein